MNEEHIEAINTLTAIHWRLLADHDTCSPIRAAIEKIDEANEALANVISGGDLVEVEVEVEPPSVHAPARWIMRDRPKPRRLEPAHGVMSPRRMWAA